VRAAILAAHKMDKPSINQSTIKCWARRMPRRVAVEATFEAPKASGEPGQYRIQIVIDARTKGIIGLPIFHSRDHAGKFSAFQDARRLDRKRQMAREVRDVFLKSASWEALRGREPDPAVIIDPEGKEIRRERR
jgi:hypothetical protein